MPEKRAFQLPRLLGQVDCAPLGYEGLVVHFWLNLTYDPDRVPDEDWRAEKKLDKDTPRDPAWESDFYYSLGRMIEKVVVPAAFSRTGEEEEIPIRDGRDLYDLLHTPGFEQQIVTWASSHYYALRHERLNAELKN